MALVERSLAGGVLTVTLNDEPRRNALSADLRRLADEVGQHERAASEEGRRLAGLEERLRVFAPFGVEPPAAFAASLAACACFSASDACFCASAIAFSASSSAFSAAARASSADAIAPSAITKYWWSAAEGSPVTSSSSNESSGLTSTAAPFPLAATCTRPTETDALPAVEEAIGRMSTFLPLFLLLNPTIATLAPPRSISRT